MILVKFKKTVTWIGRVYRNEILRPLRNSAMFMQSEKTHNLSLQIIYPFHVSYSRYKKNYEMSIAEKFSRTIQRFEYGNDPANLESLTESNQIWENKHSHLNRKEQSYVSQ